MHCMWGAHTRNLPANPHHEGAEEVAGQVLNDGEGHHKNDQHHDGNDGPIDAGVHACPHGENGLGEDVAACEAGPRQRCGYIGPPCRHQGSLGTAEA